MVKIRSWLYKGYILLHTEQHINSLKPLRKQYSKNTDSDNPNEAKLRPSESDLLDKAITKLELERDNKLKEK